MSAGLVGSVNARAVHGWSRDADCVLLDGSAVPGGTTGPAGSPPDGDFADELTGHRRASPVDADDPATILTRICQPAGVHTRTGLDGLADLAENGNGPLVVADAGLRLGLPGHLDLLDVPGDPTAALLTDPHQIEGPRQRLSGIANATAARVGPDASAIESSGTSRHTVSNPNRVVVGLLRIGAADRQRAAQLWRAAARSAAEPEPEPHQTRPDPFDLALLTLVRGGLRVGNQPAGYYSWSRPGVVASGSGGSRWQQRLRSASRTGDGAYSAAVIRPLSRLVTRLSLRVNITPNALTILSLAIGVATGLAILTGTTGAWIGAAVGLQLALVIDCCDGEVARFTRRFSTFGGWLDGIGDRVKEYLVFAALAAVSPGDWSAWMLAMIAMAVVTARHLEDYAYHDRNAAARVSVAGTRPLTDPSDGGTGRMGLPGPAARATRRRFWLKKIAHVPIAERYLILSLGLLAGFPRATLIAAIAVSLFALSWTVGGRLLRALREPTIPRDSPGSGNDRLQPLDHQLDLGVLARLAGRGSVPFVAGTMILAALWLVTGVAVWSGPGRGSSVVAVGAALAAVPVVGVCWRAPLRHRLGWLALPLFGVAEAWPIVAMLGSGAHLRHGGLVCFIALAAVCYRRYELIYSIRLLGAPGHRTGVFGGEGRILAVAVIAAAASWPAVLGGPPASPVATWGMLALAAVTVTEAALSTARSWRPRQPGTTHGRQVGR